jgi:regulatory protein
MARTDPSVRQKPAAPRPTPDAYIVALQMLARRELSEAQVRRRLSRRGHEADAIEAAVVRLKAQGAIDDARVAGAIARTQTAVKKRGRLRVRRQIESAGIGAALAQRAIDELFQAIDDDVLIEEALGRRLRGGRDIEGEAEFARLYRYLVAQGFDPDHVMRTLRRRAR